MRYKVVVYVTPEELVTLENIRATFPGKFYFGGQVYDGETCRLHEEVDLRS